VEIGEGKLLNSPEVDASVAEKRLVHGTCTGGEEQSSQRWKTSGTTKTRR